jgi:hypothetical protein
MAGERTFVQFVEEVRGSLEEHAERKGYNTNGADGDNALYQFTLEIGAEPGHSVGECVYKLREVLHEPREVLPLKVAAWMFLLWRDTPTLREMRDLLPEYPNKREEAVAILKANGECRTITSAECAITETRGPDWPPCS